MKPGDTVKFKRSYIKKKAIQFQDRTNLADIMTFFNSHHKIVKVSEDVQTVTLVCPESLCIGVRSGKWCPSQKVVRLVNDTPCNCSWSFCRSKATWM
jgi:hypothetical protein